MDEITSTALPQTSPSLWLLSFLIACLAGHLLMGYVRHTRREGRTSAAAWLAPLLAMAGFGIGVTAAMALSIGSQALAFPIGYRPLGIGASAAVAVGGAAVAALLLGRWLNAATLIIAALAIGMASVASGALLVRSIGLLPGLAWSYPLLAAGAAFGAAVSAGGLWLALLGPGQGSSHRRAWRASAAALVGVGIVAAQQFVLSAADMSTQIASAYREEIAGTLVTVAAAAGAPALVGLLLFDLHLREVRAKIEGSKARRLRRRQQREQMAR